MTRAILVIVLVCAITMVQTKDLPSSNNNEKRLVQYDFHSNEYLLITTSTKIFCIKANIQHTINYENSNVVNGNIHYVDRTQNNQEGLEIIYEEFNSSNSWITDVYYDRTDNIIYANVYNGNTLKSDIISLKYNKTSGMWIKSVLFAEQSNCLGKHMLNTFPSG
jgi:hypothetical protein